MTNKTWLRSVNYRVTVPDGAIYWFRRRGRFYVCNVDRDVEHHEGVVMAAAVATAVRERKKQFSRRGSVGAMNERDDICAAKFDRQLRFRSRKSVAATAAD